MTKTLILGAAYVDVVVNVPQLPFSGGDVTGDLKSAVVGGSAFNVYGAISYVNAEDDLFVPIVKGQYANLVRNELQAKQIPELLSVSDADNGWDISMVEPSGERSFLTIPGIDQIWKNDWLERVDLDDYKYFYVSGYQVENEQIANSVLEALSKRSNDAYLLFDASPRISHLTQRTINQLLTKNVIIHCNEDEIEYFGATGDSLDEIAQKIYLKTHSPVLFTLGSKGTYYFDGNQSATIPGEKVAVVNTIGAGDTHCGGFLAGLSAGKSIADSIKLANKLAAKVVARESPSLL